MTEVIFIDAGEILDSPDHVAIDIYLITNIRNGKKYVGQAVTHRMNHHRYRPFEYRKRFKDHVSEAVCNTKKNQCSYLNSAIRKYGSENFKVELIIMCSKDKGNEMEKYYIKKHSSMYPNGYNLTPGGEQRFATEEQKKNTMLKVQQYSFGPKLERFRDVEFDHDNIDQYIHEYSVNGHIFYCVRIGGKKCTFTGKYQTKEEVRQNAVNFLKELIKIQTAT